jgi:hypothetical protein
MNKNEMPKSQNIPKNIPTIFSCDLCNYNSIIKKDFARHNLTRKHIMKQNEMINPNKSPNTPKKFVCELCQYNTMNKKDFNKHNLTQKHITNQNEKTIYENVSFLCICGLNFNSKTTLWRHQTKCSQKTKELDIVINEPTPAATNLITPELVVDLLKDNKEMKQIIIDLVKNGTNNTTNNINNTNCNNKSFNLNFFLNETCKDAMNINDFIKSIKLTVTDLMKLGDLGYVEGITKVITSNLNALNINQRPLHCSDKKRETIYIKDEDKWEKDGDKTKIINVINTLSKSHVDLLPEYRKTYPDCQNADSKLSDSYNKMIIEAMGGPGDNEKENKDKIVRNIVKCTTIEKLQNAAELECM